MRREVKKMLAIRGLFEETNSESEVDPIKALRGCAKGTNLTEKLLESRREDLELEEAKWNRI